jgi:hypothetical protein
MLDRATITYTAKVTALRAQLRCINAAAGDRAALGALYADIVGYNPFDDEPDADLIDVSLILRDFAKEAAVSMGVHWSEVESAS